MPTREQLAADNERLRAENAKLANDLAQAEHNIEFFRKILFESKSEKVPLSKEELTARLFNEAEETFIRKDLGLDADGNRIEVKSHLRGKRRPNKVDLSSLPTEDLVIDIPESEKCCGGCGGMLAKIGEEVSEKLHVPPMRPINRRTIRPKYACPQCEGVGPQGESIPAVKIAKLPPQIAGRSVINDVTLCNAITAKFAYSIPFYRFSTMLSNLGATVHRILFCRGAIRFYRKLKEAGYFESLRRELIRSPTIHVDETKLQVLREPGRTAQQLSYMHAASGSDENGRGIVIFRYQPGRSATPLAEYLRGWNGTLLSDGFASYDALCATTNWKHAGCHVHVRREFHRAWVERGKPKTGIESEVIELYREMYRIEGETKSMPSRQRLAHRCEHITAIRDKFEKIIRENLSNTPPQSRLGKALAYAKNQWHKLWLVLESGDIPLDNNRIENLIRPFVVGRKNWLFAATVAGAEASVGLYTVVQNAVLNGIDPYKYLLSLAAIINEVGSEIDWAKAMPNRIIVETVG